MKKIIYSSHFSGCGGSAFGAKKAGLEVVSGIEWDEKRPEIAELYRKNIGDHLIYRNIAEVNFSELNIPFPAERKQKNIVLVHQTSPPCQDHTTLNKKRDANSSRANILGETHDFYKIFSPEYIVLENVKLYRNSVVYKYFKSFLWSLGYKIDEHILNAADFGVPQTRKRLFMIAAAPGFELPKIEPTHVECQNDQLHLFKKSWVGWYEAIADIIDELEPSTLTEKQKQSVQLQQKKAKDGVLVSFANSGGKDGSYATRDSESPSFAITASIGEHNAIPKVLLPKEALLVQRIGYFKNPKIKNLSQPCWTLVSSLCDDGKGGTRNKVIDALIGDGETKNLSEKALARLQGFDKDYIWGDNKKINVHGLGNSVCPPVSEAICNAIKIAVSADGHN
jgi:DNA (cytosine-5)-methyltransferase 1